MMSLMTDEELATMLSRLEQQELDCQTGSGAVPGKPVCQDLSVHFEVWSEILISSVRVLRAPGLLPRLSAA